jgi:hypothetical protein
MLDDFQVLADYIPEKAVQPIVDWLHKNEVLLKISRERKTKLGDFRVEPNGKRPRISVNFNLNRYAFLITLVHEMAHAEVFWNRRAFKRIQAHGPEWQKCFSQLMEPFLNTSIFPESLLPVLRNYFEKPKASSASDINLMLALKAFDEDSNSLQLLELARGDRFIFRNQKFELIQKNRTRFQCRNLQNKRLYLIHGLAEVEISKENAKDKIKLTGEIQTEEPVKTHALKKETTQLSDLIAGNRFVFQNQSYEVIKKNRTRFQCRNLQNKRLYLIHGLAEVVKLNQ